MRRIKITAKFQGLTPEDMIGALSRLGAVTTEMFGGTSTMELVRPNGILKLVLREDGHVNLRFSPEEKVVMTVLFPKTSRTRIADDVLALLKTLGAEFSVVYVKDQVTGREIDLGDAAWLQQAVAYAKYDFEYYYPPRRLDTRRQSVFCPQMRCWPMVALEGIA